MRGFLIVILLASCTPKLRATEEQPLDWSPEASGAKHSALEHLDVLLDGKRAPTVGQHCGITGVPPAGRESTDELIELRRTDLLRRALMTAPTAEGRIYAGIALTRLGEMTEAELNALASKEKTVHVCSGCLMSEVTGTEALAYY